MAALVDESEQPPGLQMLDDIVQYFEDEGRMIDRLGESIMEGSLLSNQNFVSSIKFAGCAILPPVMTSKRREEMQKYRQQAVIAETRLAARRREKRSKALAHIYSIVDSVEEPASTSSEESSIKQTSPGELVAPFTSYGFDTVKEDSASTVSADKKTENSDLRGQREDRIKTVVTSVGDSRNQTNGIQYSTAESKTEEVLQPATNTFYSYVPGDGAARLQQALDQNKLQQQQPVSMVGSTSSSGTTVSTESDEFCQTVIARADSASIKSQTKENENSSARVPTVNPGSSQNTGVELSSLISQSLPDQMIKSPNDQNRNSQLDIDVKSHIIADAVRDIWEKSSASMNKTDEKALRNILEVKDIGSDSLKQDEKLKSDSDSHPVSISGSHINKQTLYLRDNTHDASPGPSKTPDVSVISYVSENETIHSVTDTDARDTQRQSSKHSYVPNRSEKGESKDTDQTESVSKELLGLSSGSEQLLYTVDSTQLGTASTDLGQYMKGSLDTITSTSTITEQPTESAMLMTDDECFTEELVEVRPSQLENTPPDVQGQSQIPTVRARSNSYTLEHPSPALVQANVSDVSGSGSARSRMRSVISADTSDHRVYESLENFTRSVQRKLDYSEVDDIDETGARKKLQNHHKNQVYGKVTNHSKSKDKQSREAQHTELRQEPLSEEGRQDQLNRYLKQLSQDPISALLQQNGDQQYKLPKPKHDPVLPRPQKDDRRPETTDQQNGHSEWTEGDHPAAEGAYALPPTGNDLSTLEDMHLDLASLQHMTAEQLEEQFEETRRRLMMQQQMQLQQLFQQQQEERLRLQQEVVVQEKLLQNHGHQSSLNADDQVLNQELEQDCEKWSLQLQHRIQLQELDNLENRVPVGHDPEIPDGAEYQHGHFNVAQYASPLRERKYNTNQNKQMLNGNIAGKPEVKKKAQRKLNVETEDKLSDDAALTRRFEKVSAAVKGYLTRALVRTDKVQYLIKTIRDTADFAVNFQSETPIKKGVYSMQDKNLQDRVVAQLRAALLEIHDIFFEIPVAERMNIIEHQRQRDLQKVFVQTNTRGVIKKNQVKRRVSDATKKAMERRHKAQAAEIAVFGQARPKTAPPPNTSSPKPTDLSGPIRRNYQFLFNRALQPIQGDISPIKPVKDNLNRVVAGERPRTAPPADAGAPSGGQQVKQKANGIVPAQGKVVKKTLYGAVMGIGKKKTARPTSPKNKVKVKTKK